MDLRTKAMTAETLSNPLDEAVKQRDQKIFAMVRRAIAHQEVILAFQPVVGATDPAKPRFFESLLRVLDETGRVIPAEQFLPFVMHDEIARELDCLALDLSLKQMARHPKLGLSVNMSARSIGYRPWIDILNTAIARRPDISKRLILEISEPSVMELPELVMDIMSEQQLRGIAFALDDYGSGPTSFKLLKDMFFDVIKVDGGFTSKIHKDSENQVLAGAIAQMAHQLDMRSVATKVESRREARVMTRLGFTFLQGYQFGAPTISPPWDPIKRSTKAA
jgi:EAL domain-containing protein (putative c-di-GMP-specific phosphodiesterase class I)